MVGGLSQERSSRIQLPVSVTTVGGRYLSRPLRCGQSVSGAWHTAADGSAKNSMGEKAWV
jgi:hypothetical protein